MTSGLPDLRPAVRVQFADQLSHLHDSQRSEVRQSSINSLYAIVSIAFAGLLHPGSC